MKLGLPPVAASGDDFKTATAHEGLRENRLVDAADVRAYPWVPHIGDTVHTVSLSRNSFRTQLLTSLLLCWAIQFASLKAIFTLNFTPQNGCSLINSLTGKGGLTTTQRGVAGVGSNPFILVGRLDFSRPDDPAIASF